MHDGRDLLREFWRVGVRVQHAGDRFRLSPRGVADEILRYTLGAYAEDVAAVLIRLPASDRCQICGEPTNGYGKSLVNCGTCASIAAERMLGRLGIELPSGVNRAHRTPVRAVPGVFRAVDAWRIQRCISTLTVVSETAIYNRHATWRPQAA